jgi:hypothetical protein
VVQGLLGGDLTMATRVIKVRSLPRPGFRAFFRGGHRWPVEGRVVRVSDELFAVLAAEDMLAKDPAPEGVEPEDGVLQYIDNRGDDRAHNAAYAARVEGERLLKEKAALELEQQNEALRKEVEELRAKVAAKPPKPQGKADKQ